MATVIFYEKPGCINNTRQKQRLQDSGHQVVARNLLTETWDANRLRAFFGTMPLAQWFNPAAPRIKSGAVDPARLTADEALQLMLADPLLIRRPLMQVGQEYQAGFDPEQVSAWIGLTEVDDPVDIQACPKQHLDQPCKPPAE